MYTPEFTLLIKTIYIIFTLLFVKSLLDHTKQLGYINTIFTTRYVPQHLSPLRKYFRYIQNNGILYEILICLTIFFVCIYPVLINFIEFGEFIITKKSIFYSTSLLFCLSIIRIVNFIPDFFRLSNIELDSKPVETENGNYNTINYVTEKKVLEKFLLDHEVKELHALYPRKFLDGELFIDFLKRKPNPEAWFNIKIKINNVTPQQVYEAVCKYAYDILKLLNESLVDINSFVLSFHIRLPKDKKRSIFIRTSRNEITEILQKKLSAIQSIENCENKQFDELYRDLK